MKKATIDNVAQWFLRVALAAGFLSAVADRFGLWGSAGAPHVAWGSWQPFVEYVAQLNWFVPAGSNSCARLDVDFGGSGARFRSAHWVEIAVGRTCGWPASFVVCPYYDSGARAETGIGFLRLCCRGWGVSVGSDL